MVDIKFSPKLSTAYLLPMSYQENYLMFTKLTLKHFKVTNQDVVKDTD
jgi:hypothetical protein